NQGFFQPIHDLVLQAFQTERLLPTNDGSFVSAPQSRLARGSDLRRLLSADQLQLLFRAKHRLHWLSDDITEDRAHALREYLRTSLNVVEVTPELFATRFDDVFVGAQNDRWMAEFYAFLGGQKALWRASNSVTGSIRN